MADGVADVLDGDALRAHDRHGGVTSLVGVPVSESGAAGHLGEPPVEVVAGVGTPVRVAEHEVVLPVLTCGEAFGCLPLPVRPERGDGAFGQDQAAA